jgi:hypothetical protein
LEHEWFKGEDIHDYLSKSVDSPFEANIQLSMSIPCSSPFEIKEWKAMIDKDLKQLQIKAIYHRKNTYVRRYQSVDADDQPRKTMVVSPTYANKHSAGGKVQTNGSLLQKLTHKRSTSDCQSKAEPRRSHSN